MTNQRLQLAVDIGGTFTDLYLDDDAGVTASYKSPTTYDDLTKGVHSVLQKAADDLGESLEEMLGRTTSFVHGTTVATNAIIEGTTAPTALLVTDGFRDVLWMRDGGKEDPYDWDMDYPDPFVPRRLTFGIEERVTAEGDIVTPLNEAQARRVVQTIGKRDDVEAIAVSLLWAHAFPEHERRLGEIIEEEVPQMDYSLSHRVNPIIREYRRTSSTAIDASLSELVPQYLGDLERRLAELGFEGKPLIVTSNGGVMHPEELRKTPVWTVDAGPTMLPVAAAHVTNHELGHENVIAVDMGGTSIDIGVVRDGDIPRTREATVGDDYVLGIEKVDVKSVGAGGGSIAWVDAGNLLHVGPRSAGSTPGPACYQRGGDEPTVTDAALVLGYLNEDYFLGGTMEISRNAAEDAIEEHVAKDLGIDVVEAAHTIYTAAAQTSLNGIREVTIERGIDPRQFTLFGGGGSFGLFAAAIADELRTDEVLLPAESGVVSSVGCVASDVRRDFTTSHFTRSDDFDFEQVNELLDTLGSRADAFLNRTDMPQDRRSLSRFASARYPQQVWELEVELPSSKLNSESLAALVERFHEVHESTYGFRTDEHVEFLDWRIEANGHTQTSPITDQVDGGQPDTNEADGSRTPVRETRPIYVDDSWVDGKVYRVSSLHPGATMSGPAILEGENTTIVLPSASSLSVTESGNFRLNP